MKKKFLSNLLLIILLNLLIKPLYILGVDAEVINRVGESEYGLYFAIINLTFLCNIFLDLGINNFNVKNLAQHSFLLQKYFSKIIPLKFILGALYVLIVGIIGIFLDYDLKILLFLSINQFLAVLLLYFRSNLSGLHLFFEDSIISILDRFLLIVICSVLLWGGLTSSPFQIMWFVYAQTISYLFAVFISAILIFKKTSQLRLQWDPVFSLAILKKSFPYALLILLMTIYYRIDVIMIEFIKGPSEAGIYAGSFRFFEASNMIAYLFAVLLLPIFSRILKNQKSVNEIVFIGFKILITFSLILFFISIFYNHNIIEFRYGFGQFQDIDKFLEESFKIFPVLMFCFLFISSTYVFGTLLTANGNLYQLNQIAFFGVVINIVLNFFLISSQGAFGASLASLFTQAVTSILQIYLCLKIFDLKSLQFIIQPILFFIIGLVLIGLNTIDLTEKWYLNIFLFGLLSIIWSMITGMIRFRYIKYIFST